MAITPVGPPTERRPWRRQPPEVQLDAGREQCRFHAGKDASVPGVPLCCGALCRRLRRDADEAVGGPTGLDAGRVQFRFYAGEDAGGPWMPA